MGVSKPSSQNACAAPGRQSSQQASQSSPRRGALHLTPALPTGCRSQPTSGRLPSCHEQPLARGLPMVLTRSGSPTRTAGANKTPSTRRPACLGWLCQSPPLDLPPERLTAQPSEPARLPGHAVEPPSGPLLHATQSTTTMHPCIRTQTLSGLRLRDRITLSSQSRACPTRAERPIASQESEEFLAFSAPVRVDTWRPLR